MSEPNLTWEPWTSPPVPAEAVQVWEEEFGMRLPGKLARALAEQNGGRVCKTDLVIEPLNGFTTLHDEQWDHVVADGPLAALDRSRLLVIGEATGCGIVLDYASGGEPRVLLLHHNLGGELRDAGIGSFEELLRVIRTSPNSDLP
jgi:hypothetical protein